MARPTTKKDLIEVANDQYNKLCNLIDNMSEEEQNKEFVFDKKSMGKEAY